MRTAFIGLCLSFLVSCLNDVGPAGDVSGVWQASAQPFGVTLNLAQRGDSVTGTGSSWAFASPSSPTFSIAGRYSRPHLGLTFSRDTTVLAQLAGTVISPDRLVGVQAFVNGADTLTFVRQH